MVPQTLWGKNLRALLTQTQWDIVRKGAYIRAGYRCRICGERGPQWPVEADEAWDYDDDALTHTLKGVIALCPDCHHVRHWGKSMVEERTDETLAHLMKINGMERAQAESMVQEALEQWERRSRKIWISDYSWVTRTHGFAINPEGYARADAANAELTGIARIQRTAKQANMSSPAAIPAPPRAASLWTRIRRGFGALWGPVTRNDYSD